MARGYLIAAAIMGLILALMPAVSLAQAAQMPARLCAAAVPAADPATREFPNGPEQVLQPGVDYRAIFCTGAGPVYVDLFETATPETVNSFVFLAQNGFYNNTTFRTAGEGLMVLGGDPTATGPGAPGYFFDDEIVGYLNFDRPGQLAMANDGPDANGSRFMFTTGIASILSYEHSIFGEVLDGMENVASIGLSDHSTANTAVRRLDTVLVITDASTVAVDAPPLDDATIEDLQNALNLALSGVNGPEATNVETTGIFDLDATVAQAPDAAQDAFRAALQENSFSARVRIAVKNAACDFSPGYALTAANGYLLDVYATGDDASAALASGAYGQVLEADGFTPTSVENLTQPVYTKPVTQCDQLMNVAVTQWQRGRMVAELSATVPASNSFGAIPALTRLVSREYEWYFGDVLRAELR